MRTQKPRPRVSAGLACYRCFRVHSGTWQYIINQSLLTPTFILGFLSNKIKENISEFVQDKFCCQTSRPLLNQINFTIVSIKILIRDLNLCIVYIYDLHLNSLKTLSLFLIYLHKSRYFIHKNYIASWINTVSALVQKLFSPFNIVKGALIVSMHIVNTK